MGRLFFLLEHTAFEKSSGSVAMISVTAESTAALFMSSLNQKRACASKIFFWYARMARIGRFNGN